MKNFLCVSHHLLLANFLSHFKDENPDIFYGIAHNQSVITLQGLGCDKRKRHYKLNHSLTYTCSICGVYVSDRFTG